MYAAQVTSQNAEDPLAGLTITQDAPERAGHVPSDWVRVAVQSSSLNHHDLWSLRGVGLPADRLPMTLGTDAAGVTDDGQEVIVHSVISDPGWRGDETLDPSRTLLSEKYPGTIADFVWVPAQNLVAKPKELSWPAAACLSTAYLTAYRMLFTAGALRPGDSVLIQGAGGGVATAATALARAAGLRVYVTSRSEEKRGRALEIGAHEALPTGERVPQQVDAVLETVGEATWSHSLRSVKPGGKIVVAGATTGQSPDPELNRVFFRSVQVVGTTMGTRSELESLIDFLLATGVRPEIDYVESFFDPVPAFERLLSGAAFGKVVLFAC
ncbi:MAG TPA: zinc-binding dehydrogenase [Actinomycetales bacterium]|nr:zinc-binding dehydrogenase [Actinomycetales bacterium]